MLGEVIRITRVANDMTNSTLSEKSGVSISYITEIEKGKKNPSTDILNKLAIALNLKQEDLYELDELHNELIKSKEKLSVYRILLISILELYNSRQGQEAIVKVRTKSLASNKLDNCHK